MFTYPGDPSRVKALRDVMLPEGVVSLVALDGVIPRLEAAFHPYDLRLARRAGGVQLSGDDLAVGLAEKVFARLAEVTRDRGRLGLHDVAEGLRSVIQHELKYDLSFRLEGVPQPVRPMNLAQAAFMNAILYDPHPLMFGVGPTGTGKTHLALAAGLNLLARGAVKRLVVTRPLVRLEGETMNLARRAELVDEGQLTAIMDELAALVGHDPARRLVDEGEVEVVPLGRLRGRTFNESFILVDEAQNLTIPHMRMVLTRLGRDSRAVVAGDPQQVDLLGDEPSGLQHVLEMIAGRDLALVHRFQQREIIRNPLVAELEALYAGEARSASGRPVAGLAAAAA